MKHDILVQRLTSRMAEMKTNASKVSVEAKLGKTAVRDIIAGKSKRPTMDTIARIAKVLNCTLAYLVGDVDDPTQMRTIDGPLDMQIMSIRLIAEAGNFKRDTHPSSPMETPVIEHPGYADHALKACLMGDNSMREYGILKGDVLTIASPFGDTRIPLEPGTIVICAQTITPPMVTEISARIVRVRNGKTELWTEVSEGTWDIVRIDHQPPQFPENLYISEHGNGITIEGIVIRLMRDMG